jgi:hypothetical protein
MCRETFKPSRNEDRIYILQYNIYLVQWMVIHLFKYLLWDPKILHPFNKCLPLDFDLRECNPFQYPQLTYPGINFNINIFN